MKRTAFCALVALASFGTAHAQQRGVTDHEIALGTIQDLSGPLAVYGRQIRDGLQMRVDEANQQGGIHGRKLRLVVEDSGYDPKRAAAAAQKLIDQDHIFLAIGNLGTPTALAAMKVQTEQGVINFYPSSTAKEMYEPPHRLKYAIGSSYFDQMRIAAPKLMKDRRLNKACALYQDDDFGQEVLEGAEVGLRTVNARVVEKVPYARGATDFSPHVAKLKAAGCDLVVLGTVIRETAGAMTEARRIGFNPTFVANNGVYSDAVIRAGGKAVEGLYAAMTAQQPYMDDAEPRIREWAQKYKARFNEEPGVSSVRGYVAMDTFVRAALKVGRKLDTDSFVQVMDTMSFARNLFGGPETSFGPAKRYGSNLSRLSQVQDGRWKVVSEYVAFTGLRPVQQKDGRWTVESDYFKDQP